MSKKEEVKTNIETLRALILAFLTALFGVSSYTFIERKALGWYEFGFLALIIMFLFSCVCICAVLYNKQRKKLRDL